jgi:regulator of cell morphogenesis and NO signaling
MKKEELILFPFIQNMVKAQKENQPIREPHFGTVENPIAMMKDEHSIEGERFDKIATLTDGLIPPEDACSTYRVTYQMLKEFEQDLHKHIHLENNILFPIAIRLQAVFE